MQNHREIILDLLPDIPRWIEARSMLISGRGMVLDFHQKDPSSQAYAALFQEDIGLGVLVGEPHQDLIYQLSELADEIICPAEYGNSALSVLEHWDKEEANLFRRPRDYRNPYATKEVRRLSLRQLESIDGIPSLLFEELREELVSGTEIFYVAKGEQAASFCYAGAKTEKYWDISIETLPPFYRQGLATRCVCGAIEEMWTHGLEPIWAAVDANTASVKMANKLGFNAVDRLKIFTRVRD